MLLGQLRRVVNEGIGTGQLQGFEVTVRDLGFLDLLVLRVELGFTLTLQAVLDQQQTGFLAHHQSLVDVDDVGQRFQLVRQLFHVGVAVLVRQLDVHLFRCHVGRLVGRTAVAEEAAACIAGLQHRVQLFFGLAAVEQFGWSAEEHHVGRSATHDLLVANAVSRVLDQLLLDQTYVVQLQKRVQDLYVADQVGADLVDLQVHGACIGHQQLVTHLLDRWCCTRVKTEHQRAKAIELLLHTHQLLIGISAFAVGSFECQLWQVVLSQDRKGLLQKPRTELVDHRVLDDVG